MPTEVQGFLLCDSVVVDARTGKAVIQGIFDKVFSPQYPAIHPRCAIFVRLRPPSDQNSCDISLRFRTPSRSEQVLIPPQNLAVGDTGVIQAVFEVHGLPLAEQGTYAFELFVNELLLSTFRLMASVMGVPNVSSATTGRIH
jgi:Family of unknown function (DUF6941)